MAFGGGVVLPGVLQWLSSIAWDALAALFGAEALTLLLGIPFWVAALIVLGDQGLVGFFGYELIHRLQAVMTVVLFTTFVVFAVKLVGGQEVVTPPTVSGADLSGAVVLEVTIAFSLAVSWASYAADFSRYLPATSSPARVFGFTFAGVVLGLFFVEGIGIAAGDVVAYQTADGVRSVMGGGLLGGVTLLIIALSSVGSGVMTQYSGSLTLQTIGHRRDGAGARSDPVAGRRRYRDAVSGCGVAGELLDPGLCRGRQYRLADQNPRSDHDQPGRRTHRPPRCRGRLDRVPARLLGRDPLYEHDVDTRTDRAGVAWRRHCVFRGPSGGCIALRRLPAAPGPSLRSRSTPMISVTDRPVRCHWKQMRWSLCRVRVGDNVFAVAPANARRFGV